MEKLGKEGVKPFEHTMTARSRRMFKLHDCAQRQIFEHLSTQFGALSKKDWTDNARIVSITFDEVEDVSSGLTHTIDYTHDTQNPQSGHVHARVVLGREYAALSTGSICAVLVIEPVVPRRSRVHLAGAGDVHHS